MSGDAISTGAAAKRLSYRGLRGQPAECGAPASSPVTSGVERYEEVVDLSPRFGVDGDSAATVGTDEDASVGDHDPLYVEKRRTRIAGGRTLPQQTE